MYRSVSVSRALFFLLAATNVNNYMLPNWRSWCSMLHFPIHDVIKPRHKIQWRTVARNPDTGTKLLPPFPAHPINRSPSSSTGPPKSNPNFIAWRIQSDSIVSPSTSPPAPQLIHPVYHNPWNECTRNHNHIPSVSHGLALSL